MLLLAFAIVSSLQAVGVVLVSAMLVIPAAAAFLLTDRWGRCWSFRRSLEWFPGARAPSFLSSAAICPQVLSWCWLRGRYSRRRSSSVRGTAFFPAGGGSAPGPRGFPARTRLRRFITSWRIEDFADRTGEHARTRRAPPRDARRGPASTWHASPPSICHHVKRRRLRIPHAGGMAPRLRNRPQSPALGALSYQRCAHCRPITSMRMRRRSSTSLARRPFACSRSGSTTPTAIRTAG